MKTKKSNSFTLFSILLAITLILSATSLTAFAAQGNSKSTIVFDNLDEIGMNEIIEYDFTDSEGNPATVGIERISNPLARAGQSWKVWYSSGVISASFYMDVDNNKVTRVYDDSIMVLAGTFSNDSLTKTSTEGKLTFTVTAIGGIANSKCWLKGTVTGSGNQISVSWDM